MNTNQILKYLLAVLIGMLIGAKVLWELIVWAWNDEDDRPTLSNPFG